MAKSTKNNAKKSPYPKMPHPAVMAIWAALIAAAKLLPSIALVGTGGTLSVAAALLPLSGVFFGPFGGALIAAIGGFIGQIIAPATAWVGIFTFTIGTVSAFVAGMVAYKRWWYACLIGIACTCVWFSQEIGRKAWFFAAAMFGTGIVIACVIGILNSNFKWLSSKNPIFKTIALYCTCLSGMLISGAYAGIFQIFLFKMPVITYKMLVFTAPMERVGLAVAAAVIGIPLLYALPKIGIYIGPGAQDLDDEEIALDAAMDQESQQ